MARPTLDRNVKFKRLCRELGLPKPYVRGLLETMWDCAHECGDPVLGDATDVEAAAEWPGDAGIFAAVVTLVGFVDLRPDGSLEIHDYWVHAPEYVKKRREREMERQTRGDALDSVADNGRQRQTTARNGMTPAPAPAPAPTSPNGDGSARKRAPRPPFVQPLLDEVRAYCQERNNRVDPERFLAHYESNGWKVGRNPMKDWKAAIRGTWEHNDGGRPPAAKRPDPGRHVDASPWHADDVATHSGHPQWDSYLDHMAGRPAPWQRFTDWLELREGA